MSIALNPAQQADIIRKQGGFIPDTRPGPSTGRYLGKVLNRITLPGALFLTLASLEKSHRSRRDEPTLLAPAGSDDSRRSLPETLAMALAVRKLATLRAPHNRFSEPMAPLPLLLSKSLRRECWCLWCEREIALDIAP